MKKIFLAIAVIFLFATCKKDSSSSTTTPPVTLLDATGSWSLYSNNNTYFTSGLVTVADYPCIGDNILTLKADSTYSSSYTGADTCYVTASHAIGSAVTMGTPGVAPVTGTWHRNGNNIYIGALEYGIAKVNGALILNLNYSLTINGVGYTVTAVYNKK